MIQGAPPPAASDINRILRGCGREVRDLLLLVHRQGFAVSPTKNNHYKVVTPPGTEKKTVFMPGTPSDSRCLGRLRRKLRHIGADIPHT